MRAPRGRAGAATLALLALSFASAGCGQRLIGRLPTADGGTGGNGKGGGGGGGSGGRGAPIAGAGGDGGSTSDAGGNGGSTSDAGGNGGGASDAGGNGGSTSDAGGNGGGASDAGGNGGSTSDAGGNGGSTSDAGGNGGGASDAGGNGGGTSDAGGNGGGTSDAGDAAIDAPLDGASDDAPVPFGGSVAGRVAMSGTAGGNPVVGAGVAGVAVALRGPLDRDAITDANGAFRFGDLPAGSYALAVAKPGATFTPDHAEALAVDGGGPGLFQTFACAAPCGAGPTIDYARELIFQDPTVLSEAEGARADNATKGAWSFRFLMEQIASGMSPNAFAETWLENWAATGRDLTRLRRQWPTIVENGQTLPDLARAPFRLLAIVNRIDAGATGNGELRFIYGLKVVSGAPELNGQSLTLTVALHFWLPSTSANPDRRAWARRFHELAAIPLDGSDAFAAALQTVTDLVVRAGVLPSLAENPRGTSFAVLRTSDGFTSGPGSEGWQLREFRPRLALAQSELTLVVDTVRQTPDASLNGSAGSLPDFLNANATLVETGLAILPPALLGTRATFPLPAARWSFPGVTAEPLRRAFAGQTCTGCHGTEAATPTPTFHMSPSSGAVSGNYSGLVLVQEIPRRIAYLQHLLACTPPACAAGGEEMLGP